MLFARLILLPPKTTTALLTAFLLSASGGASAAAGDLDLTFGGTGVVQVGASGELPAPFGIAYKRNSVITLGAGGPPGVSHVRIYKNNEDGSVDAAFGTGGSVLLTALPRGDAADVRVAIDKLDRIVGAFVGPTELTIARVTEAGALDATFGTGGYATFAVSNTHPIIDVAAQLDRKIVFVTSARNPATGNQEALIGRYREDGTLDGAFGTGGLVYFAAPGAVGPTRGASIAVQADGKIVISGRYRSTPTNHSGYVLRLHADGRIDAGFGAGGLTVIDWLPDALNAARGLAIQGDGKIVTGSGVYPNDGSPASVALARLLPSGALDAGFGVGGKVVQPVGPFGGSWYEVAVQSTGKIVVGGLRIDDPVLSTHLMSILRFNSDGSIDTSFSGDGYFDYRPDPTMPHIVGSMMSIDRSDRILGFYSQVTDPTVPKGHLLTIRIETGTICR